VRAWWTFWATLAVAVVIWIGAVVVGGREGLRSMLSNLGLVILLLPIAAAGLNLVLYRHQHEVVCRLEVERHRSLRLIAGNGYSATMFATTGGMLLGLVAVILVLQVTRA